MLLRPLLLAALFTLSLSPAAQAQDAQVMGGGGQFAGMERISGEVTAATPSALTIKATDGVIYTVTATDNTRIMRGRGNTVKFADLKVGDGVMALGNLDAPKKTLHAALLFATDAEQVKALKENMGKTYISGKVTAIDLDNAKMTIERTDNIAQTIAFDETTSFKRASGGRGPRPTVDSPQAAAPTRSVAESITLADFKVGDTVAGRGTLKSGTFVPTELTIVPDPRHRSAGPQ